MSAGGRAKDAGKAPSPEAEVTATEQRIVVRDLIVSSSIGVSTEERARPQRLSINLEVEMAPRVPDSDKIVEVVNYGPLVRRVREICADSRVRLLETLAAAVAKTCFMDDKVTAVSVRIEKLDRYPDVGGVGVAIVYGRGGAGAKTGSETAQADST